MRRAAGIAAALLLAAAAVLALAAPAEAHADLVSTDPAAGAALSALPAEITLTFTQPPLTGRGITIVRVTDAAGRSLTKGDPRVEGVLVTQRLDGPAAGPVDVQYHVVTDDGHPTTGAYTFTVAGTAPRATPTPTSTPSPTSTAIAAAEAAAVPTWDPTAQAAASAPTDIAPLLAVLTALFAALAGAVVVLALALRRPHRPVTGSGTGPEARSTADSDR